MRELAVFAVTEGGSEHRVNEDSFQLMKMIFPDTLDNYEEKSLNVSDDWQIYSICDGLGGPGVGDIAGRLVQDLLKERLQALTRENPADFDFPLFAQEFLDEADALLKQRLSEVDGQAVGCSLAFILLHGLDAFTLSIGSTRIMLYRGGELFQMTKDHRLGDSWRDRPLLFLGHHPGSAKIKAQNMKHLPLEEGDVLLLLTDGVALELAPEEIVEQLALERSFNERIRRIHHLARERCPEDNQSIVALSLPSTLGEEGAEAAPAKTTAKVNSAGETDVQRRPQQARPKRPTAPALPLEVDVPQAQPQQKHALSAKALFLYSLLGGLLLGSLVLLLFYYLVLLS